MTKRIQVIINPASGKDQPTLSMLNNVFHDADVKWEVAVTHDPGDARELARTAVKARVDLVAAYGGDGTITEVATGLAGSTVPLGVLPGGTANFFAAGLEIPMALEDAASLLIGDDSKVIRMDMGRVQDQHFMIGIGIGLVGAVADGADRERKDRLGFLAYVAAAFEALRDARVSRYRLTLDGKKVETEGVTCVVVNMGHMKFAGAQLFPSIDRSDGLFDVMVMGKANIDAFLSLIPLATRDGFDTPGPFEAWQAKEIEIEADPPQAIQADGEMLEPGPVRISVLPSALQVIVPKSLA